MHLRADLVFGRKLLLGRLVFYVFDAAHKAQAAHVANVRVTSQGLLEPREQELPLVARLADQILSLDQIEHGERHRTADGMGVYVKACIQTLSATSNISAMRSLMPTPPSGK